MTYSMGEYEAAREGLALCDRSHRSRLLVSGRAPIAAFEGLLTGRMPDAPGPFEDGLTGSRIEYSAVLTPKGRVIADLRAMWGPTPDEEGLLLDVPASAIEALLSHFKRYVPPRLATIEDVSTDSAIVTVLGPAAAGATGEIVLGSPSYTARVEGLVEGEFLEAEEDGTRVARTHDVDVPAWDVFLPAGRLRALWDELMEAGATPIGSEVWDTLRVEAGRPEHGVDMDESTILSETGLVDRAVDDAKGCYTGQEVIVRIRDRGHVNRSLRGLLFAEGPVPEPGVELFLEDRAVGGVTSAVDSPRHGGPVGLGFVHRDVPDGGEVAVGSPAGLRAAVRALGPDWTSPASP